MERVLEYARSQGVEIRLWVHWKPLSEQLVAAFAQYERWGVAGLMVDFLDRDDQDMVRFAEEVLQSAVRHHLHVHFHGVWKPTGLQRTYPPDHRPRPVLPTRHAVGQRVGIDSSTSPAGDPGRPFCCAGFVRDRHENQRKPARALWIRDNLSLNIIVLVHPVQAIKA